MNNALAVYNDGGFEVMQRAAKAMLDSGYFKDSGDIAKAVVKVMAGAELGIAPFAAMSGIHIVQGRPTLSSNLIATLVKNDGRYNYRVRVANDSECVIVWFEDGQECGESSFTMQEAQTAQLTGKAVWKQYPSDMLFARALTRGARRFAPGIFGGAPVYTPEEVGADIDWDGNIIEGEVVAEPPKPAPKKAPKQEPLDELWPEDAVIDDIPFDPDPQEQSHKIADVRAMLEESKVKPTLGVVADRAALTGLYDNPHHALTAMRQFDFPEGVKVQMAQKVSIEGALKVFDWLMARKEVDGE